MARSEPATGMRRLTSGLALIALLLRRLRLELGILLTLICVVVITAFAVSAAPQLFNEMSDDGLRMAVERATSINRHISVERGDRIAPGDGSDIFSNVVAASTQFRSELPDSVQTIIDDQQYVVDSPQFTVQALPGEPPSPFPTFLRLRYQEGIPDQVQFVDGRMPAPRGPEMLDTGEGAVEVPVYEIAVTAETLEELRVPLGGRVVIAPDEDDPLNRGVPRSELDYQMLAQVVGIIEMTEPDAPYWFDDLRLHRPVIVENPDFVLIYTMGLLSPEDYPRLLDRTAPSLWNYSTRYFVDPEEINAGAADQLASDIRNLEVVYGAPALASVDDLKFRTGLSRIIDNFKEQRQLTIAMLSLAAIGLIAIGLAVIALLAALIVDRRRETTILTRSRGAGARQLIWAGIAEGMLVSLPAAFLGYLLAVLLVPGRLSLFSVAGFAGLTAGTTALLVVAALPLIKQDLGVILNEREIAQRASARRIVIELGIAALALVAVFLFRRRGLEAGSLSDPDAGFDPLLAATPVLIGLAAGILTLRLYPLLIRFFGWAGSLRRDLVPFVGFRRINQQPPSARLPILVILLAVAIAVFSSILRYSIDEGQEESTWHDVGADFKVEASLGSATLPRRLDFSTIQGIEALADGFLVPTANINIQGPRLTQVSLLAITTSDYVDVTEGTRAAPDFPESMLSEQIVTDIGTEANPIPAIISSQWSAEQSLSTGDTFGAELQRMDVVFIVRDVRDRFPGLSYDRPFVVTSLESLRAIDPTREIRANRIYIRGPAELGDDIREEVRGLTLAADIMSRDAEFEALNDAPLVSGVTTGFTLSQILAGIYAILAAIAALALTARARARDLGYLRTLGLSTGQSVWLTVIEQLPPVVIAAAAGTALGAGLVELIEPGIELSVFAGEVLPAVIIIDWWSVGAVVGGLVAAVAVAIALFSYLTRKMNLGSVLRLGEVT